jgi:hypothetical protein
LVVFGPVGFGSLFPFLHLPHMVKHNKAYLSKLEDLISEGGYMVRYERGNFKSGYCVLKDNKLVLVNNFLPVDGRVNCLLELAHILPLDEENLSEKSRKLWLQLKNPKTNQPEIDFNSEPAIN